MKTMISALAVLALGSVHGTASAISVGCTVSSGTVLTSTLGGLGFSIANGIGTSTGGATGTISCPSISTGVGLLTNYKVLATADYQGGPFATTSGTRVTEVFTLVGGALNGASFAAQIDGGNSSSGVVGGTPFQIGSTLSGATSYGGFTVNVASSVTLGGPVSGSSGQVVISYDVSPVPEPGTWAMMLAGVGVLAAAARRRRG